MDFELGEEQRAMRKMMRDFVEKEVFPNVERWEEMGELNSKLETRNFLARD